MNWFDIVLVIIIVFGAVGGYREGFLMEVISLLAIFLGVLAGFKLLGKAMVMLGSRFDINQSMLPYIAFGVVFLIIVVAVSLLGQLIKASINKSVLGRIDQAMGALVGMIKIIFMMSVFIWLMDSMELDFFSKLTADSRLTPWLEDVAPRATALVGSVIPFFSDVFHR